jgi:hypothetical protein
VKQNIKMKKSESTNWKTSHINKSSLSLFSSLTYTVSGFWHFQEKHQIRCWLFVPLNVEMCISIMVLTYFFHIVVLIHRRSIGWQLLHVKMHVLWWRICIFVGHEPCLTQITYSHRNLRVKFDTDYGSRHNLRNWVSFLVHRTNSLVGCL